MPNIDAWLLGPLEQIDLLERWEGERAPNCKTLTSIIADAQLTKAVEGIADWLDDLESSLDVRLRGDRVRLGDYLREQLLAANSTRAKDD